MAEKNNLFKLDTNIDGTYFNQDNELKVISNMIQVVGEMDGTSYFPSSKNINASLDEDELPSISDVDNVTNTRGHGILYDEDGVPYAYKGDMVIRDGQGNVITLGKATTKANSIYEKGRELSLRDRSLQAFNRSDEGVELENLIQAAQQRSTAFGGGNIVQVARNEEFNSSSVDLYTIRLSPLHSVWITGTVIVNGPTQIQLVDVTTDTVLHTSYIDHRNGNLLPCYVSYVGTLPSTVSGTVITEEICEP
jgi:hypothetical protein